MGQKYISTLKKYWLPISVIGLTFLFGLTIFYSLYEQRVSLDKLIHSDINKLSLALESINKDAKIIGFEHVQNHINFLNVVSFVGSEVGPMNLASPKGWKGPYLNDNPTMQEHYYLVVKLGSDYYITPGEGVKLSSGQRVGKNIQLDSVEGVKLLLANGLAYKLSLK